MCGVIANVIYLFQLPTLAEGMNGADFYFGLLLYPIKNGWREMSTRNLFRFRNVDSCQATICQILSSTMLLL